MASSAKQEELWKKERVKVTEEWGEYEWKDKDMTQSELDKSLGNTSTTDATVLRVIAIVKSSLTRSWIRSIDGVRRDSATLDVLRLDGVAFAITFLTQFLYLSSLSLSKNFRTRPEKFPPRCNGEPCFQLIQFRVTFFRARFKSSYSFRLHFNLQSAGKRRRLPVQE